MEYSAQAECLHTASRRRQPSVRVGPWKGNWTVYGTLPLPHLCRSSRSCVSTQLSLGSSEPHGYRGRVIAQLLEEMFLETAPSPTPPPLIASVTDGKMGLVCFSFSQALVTQLPPAPLFKVTQTGAAPTGLRRQSLWHLVLAASDL